MADATVWPPLPFNIAFARFAELDAWYTGDTSTLNTIYTGNSGVTHQVGGRTYRGGVMGTLSKWFWGQPVAPGEDRMKMHLPLAADLCTLSADLLFGEAPQVMFREPKGYVSTKDAEGKEVQYTHPAQDRLDAIVASDEAHAEWLLGGEYASALGGTYLAVAWDPTISKHVFPKAYAADCAIPMFRHGRLASVRLWTEYTDGSTIYRLIEEHQPGYIEYSLWRGREGSLGVQIPIGTLPETAHYEQLRSPSDVDALLNLGMDLPLTVSVGTGSERLAVVYMPNARPVRDWRKMGTLANLGRSDLDGIQDLLDKIDFAWTSLMRDIDNGQGRLVVDEQLLTVNGPGQGATFDSYRQVFTPVGASLGKTADSNGLMTIVQFNIRVEEHIRTIEALKKEIASAVGYSEAHLGIDKARTGGSKTATAVSADLSDSERTRDKKAMYAKAALSNWAMVALEIDYAVFGGDTLGDMSEPPDVMFAPVSQADPEKTARTVQMLDAARAASRKEIVRTVHPDWDEQQIKDEVDAIGDEEKNAALAPPIMPPFTPSGGDSMNGEPNDGGPAPV